MIRFAVRSAVGPRSFIGRRLVAPATLLGMRVLWHLGIALRERCPACGLWARLRAQPIAGEWEGSCKGCTIVITRSETGHWRATPFRWLE